MPDNNAFRSPKGFFFSAAEAAIKKPGRRDLALIVSESPSVMCGTFTTNAVKAAPVRLCMQKIRSGMGQAIIVNSGNANACTGAQGLTDARLMISRVSRSLRIPARLIYPCSTGVIGTPMPMERILPTVDNLTRGLGRFFFDDVAASIMTTDTFPKIVSRRIKVGDEEGIIAGICKGAGMIAPNMATMLCFILTDIAINGTALAGALKEIVRRSFNRITIDGDMSTNDTVLMMANGARMNRPILPGAPAFRQFVNTLEEVAFDLAWLIIKDGEGATKIIEIIVRGAKTEKEADNAAHAIANSNLVKTAIYGHDANWGRIMAALGASGIRLKESKTDIFFNRVRVVRNGLATNKNNEATEALKGKEVRITVDLRSGSASSRVLTCDLTEGYIRINAEYRT